jgi:hypothetical protein
MASEPEGGTDISIISMHFLSRVIYDSPGFFIDSRRPFIIIAKERIRQDG